MNVAVCSRPDLPIDIAATCCKAWSALLCST
jgi:hypothetical protein